MNTVLAVLTQLLSNEAVLLVLIGLAGHFYRQWRGDKATQELSAFDLGVKLAYDGVRNLQAMNPGFKLDKVQKGLEIFSKVLHQELGRQPTQAELGSAALHFDAIHAKEAEAKRVYGAMKAIVVPDPAPGNVVAGFQTPPVSP